MFKKLFGIVALAAAALAIPGCGEDCEPTALPTDEIIYVNIIKPTGGSYIKYAGNQLPADSVRITNLSTGGSVSRFLIRDSVLGIENYNKDNNAVTNLKIEIGAAGLRKPDTLQVTVARRAEKDNCDRDFEVARFAGLKMNVVTILCTTCPYNSVYTFTKP